MLPTQFYNSMFCTLENHGNQMQNKDQPLQICKLFNSCSMLFKFLGTIHITMNHLNIISTSFVYQLLCWWDNMKICNCYAF